jgi:branched-chain amino acid transport system permease protein
VREKTLRLVGALAVATVSIVLPHVLSFSQQELLVFLTINVVVVTSYRLLTLTGEWSLVHVVLMGAGGYASALYAKELGAPVALSIPAGAATSAFLAFVLSFPLFRMKGFYFLIGSFAAGEVIRLVWKRFTDPFGGATGLKRIPGLPEFELGPIAFDPYSPVHYYYLTLIVAALCVLALHLIERSRIGLTFHAIHYQDRLAQSVGIDTFRYRMLAFVVASFFAGVSGAFYAHYLSTVNPNQFDVEQMVYVVIWTIVGGTTRLYGPILGVVALTIVDEILLRGLGVPPEVRPLLYGVLLIATILFLPKGLESVIVRLGQALTSKNRGRAFLRAESGSIPADGPNQNLSRNAESFMEPPNHGD